MEKITLDLRQPHHHCDILLQPGIASDWRREVAERLPATAYLVAADSNMARHLRLPESGTREGKWRYLWVEPGESNKTIDQFSRLAEQALAMELDRKSAVVAIGGGVTGDIAGFLAACLFRGVRLAMIPTSLLAQVDSSVGGKNAVNIAARKNLIGTFYQPELVLVDPALLDTLPEREYLAGLAEVAKTAVLDGRDFFFELRGSADRILARDHQLLTATIARCCRFKAAVVTDDEKERGGRALLNLGHTFGHVLEALAGYDGRVVHGEAVSVGVALAAAFARERGLLEEADKADILDLLSALHLPVRVHELGADSDIPPDWQSLVSAEGLDRILVADKKSDSGHVTLILPHAIGNCHIEKGFDAVEVAGFIRGMV